MLKHILLTISALAFLASVQTVDAQTTHFSEDFTNGIPAAWTILDGDMNTPHPDWSAIGLSGCNSYPLVSGWEGYCGNAMSVSWYSPAGQSDDWLFTPAITIPANANNAYLRFTASTISTQRQQNFRDDYAVRIGLTTNPADHVANVLHNSNDPVFEQPIIDISQYIGQTVYISFQNYANNEYALLIDDVEVITLPEKEIIGERILVRAYSDGNISGTFSNFGYATITDAEVNYQIAGGPVETATVTGLNIAPFDSAVISHPTKYTGGGLKANIRYWVSKVNGSADANPNDNEVTKIGSNFAYTTSHKRALVENFTSSTCPPCRPGSIQLESVFAQLNNPDVIHVSNQVPWINTRDPYGTNETNNRAANYYGITGVPHTVVDGSVTRINPNGIEASDITPALEEAGFVDFDGTFEIDPVNQDVYINGKFTSGVDMYGTERLQIAIIEHKTTGNVGSNGETEFHNVLKKYVPSENGTSLGSVSNGDEYTFNQVYTFNGNYRLPPNGAAANRINHAFEHSVEEFEDLFVVVWVEYPTEQVVLNTFPLNQQWGVANDPEFDIAQLTISPNPAADFAKIEIKLQEASTVSFEVVNVEGKVVMTKDGGMLTAGNNSIELNVSDLPSGTYHVNALTETGLITRPMIVVR